MKEKIVVGEVEAEGIEVTDLGDAAKETRQFHPTQLVQDSAFQLGRPFFDE